MNYKSILLTTTALLILAGCGKITKENYDKLSVGMDYTKVTEVMGEPDSCSEVIGTKRCIWGDDVKQIKVSFIADKATLFSNKGL